MSDLDELQAVMHALLRDGLSVEAAAERLGADPSRLAIYHRFVRGHVRSALENTFPLTLGALPESAREILNAAYFAEHAPPSWDLDAAAEAFPAFLEARVGSVEGLDGFHVAVAQVEWALAMAWRDEAAVPRYADGPVPVLNPTLAILSFPYPVVAWLTAAAVATTYAAPTPRPIPARIDPPRLVFVLRHPVRETACYWAATDDLLFAFKVAHDGLEPLAAARAADLPEDAARAAIAQAVEAGVVIPPRAAAVESPPAADPAASR